MTVIDRVKKLHRQLNLPDPNDAGYNFLVSGLGRNQHTIESEAGRLLRQIEYHLNLGGRQGLYLGRRLTDAEAAAPPRRPFARGDRVEYTGTTCPRLTGRTGVLRHTLNRGWMVNLDGETVDRFFETCNLRREALPMTTIVNRVVEAVRQFANTAAPSTVDQAARELCAATKLASEGDRLKKRAKAALERLGIILPEYRPGTVVAFDGANFRIEAVTKEPAERLDELALRDYMRTTLGLSKAKIDRAFAQSRVQNKPATSIVVTEK